MDDGPSLSTSDVLTLARIPYSTLDYWVRSGLITPSIQTSIPQQRRPRRWALDDILRVRALRELYQAGCPVRLLKIAKQRLDEDWNVALTSRHLYWNGGDVFIVDEWDQVISLIGQPGQSAIRMVALPLGPFFQEIEAGYAELLDKRRKRAAAKIAERAAIPRRARQNAVSA